MQEGIKKKEFPARSLRDITDALMIEEPSLHDIVSKPRSFKVHEVTKEELRAPTLLHFEMNLNRVGNALVVTTGGKGQVPTDFGVTSWRGQLMSGAAIKESVEAIKTLVAFSNANAVQAGWQAHWHPVGAAENQHAPSLTDYAVATTLGGIHFAIDEEGISVYHGAENVERYEELRKHKDEQVSAITARTDAIRGLRKQLNEHDKEFLFREAGLKQIPWSDEERVARVCDFMNARISREELEKSLD